MNDLQISALCFQGRGPYDLQVRAGLIVGLQGASGAGKTLLLRSIADLDPHEGEVRLGDLICSRIPAPDWRRTVALLPAESVWWYDTVGEHFSASEQDFLGNLEQLGFTRDVLGWEVSRLSTGEKQRLAIARLLQNKPQALLLDEPTASLDAANIERTEQMLTDYCIQNQVPVLWVSHDPVQLQRIASEQWFLDSDGSLLPVQRG